MSKAEDILKAKENVQSQQVIKRDEVAMSQFKDIATFDWHKVPPPQLAVVISKIPFRGSAGEPNYFLQPWQAIIWAIRCFELGLSPFSGETWFNKDNNKVNITLEGKLALARKQGWQIGAPQFERVPEDYSQPLRAYICKLPVYVNKEKQILEYRADLDAWSKSKSPMWRDSTEHMLKLRSYEKALSWVTGIGASELPDDKDIEPPQPQQIPQTIHVPEIEFKQPPNVYLKDFDSNNEKENK